MSAGGERPSVAVRALGKLWREPRFHGVVWGAVGVLVVAVLAAWWSGVDWSAIKDFGGRLLAWSRESPLWLFLAIAILPALPVPASPFLILAGIVFPPKFGLFGAVLLAIAGMAINMSWTYWVAAYPGRRLVDRLLDFLEIELPPLSRGNAARLTVLLRVTPGIPFFLHNLILGFLRVPFRLYLLISLATTSLFTTGFVVFGESITSGRGKLAMLAVSLMLMAAVITSFVRSRVAARSERLRDAGEPADGT